MAVTKCWCKLGARWGANVGKARVRESEARVGYTVCIASRGVARGVVAAKEGRCELYLTPANHNWKTAFLEKRLPNHAGMQVTRVEEGHGVACIYKR